MSNLSFDTDFLLGQVPSDSLLNLSVAASLCKKNKTMCLIVDYPLLWGRANALYFSNYNIHNSKKKLHLRRMKTILMIPLSGPKELTKPKSLKRLNSCFQNKYLSGCLWIYLPSLRFQYTSISAMLLKPKTYGPVN